MIGCLTTPAEGMKPGDVLAAFPSAAEDWSPFRASRRRACRHQRTGDSINWGPIWGPCMSMRDPFLLGPCLVPLICGKLPYGVCVDDVILQH